MTRSLKSIHVAALAAICILAAAPGFAIGEETTFPGTPTPPLAPFDVRNASPASIVESGSSFSVSFEIETRTNAASLRIVVTGSPGIELVGGLAGFEIPIQADQLYAFNLTFRSVTLGEHHVQLSATIEDEGMGPYSAYIYALDDGTAVSVRSHVPDEYWANFGKNGESFQDTPGSSSGDFSTMGHCGNIVVTGSVFFNDGATTKPFVGGYVQVWDDDSGSIGGADDLLGSAFTDSTGKYTVSVDPADCTGCGTVDIFVKAYAANEEVRVVGPSSNSGSDEDAYMTESALFQNSNPSNCVQNMPTLSPTSPAYRLADFGRTSGKFLKNNVALSMPKTVIRWPLPSGDSATGVSHYHVNGMWAREIHMHTGQESLNTVAHEYGHRVMQKAMGDATTDWPNPSLGGGLCPSPHIVGIPSTRHCAWTEGWAEFYDLAARNSNAGEGFKLEWFGGDENEGTVRNALWDLYDSTVDSGGHIGHSGCELADAALQDIWNVLTDDANHFKDFLSDWNARLPSLAYWIHGSAFQNKVYDSTTSLQYETTAPTGTFLSRPDDGEVWRDGNFQADVGGGPATLAGTAAYVQPWFTSHTGDNIRVCKIVLELDEQVQVESVTTSTSVTLQLPVGFLEKNLETHTYEIRVYDFSGNFGSASQTVQFAWLLP